MYDNSFLEYHRLKCLEVLSHKRSEEGCIKSNFTQKSSGCQGAPWEHSAFRASRSLICWYIKFNWNVKSIQNSARHAGCLFRQDYLYPVQIALSSSVLYYLCRYISLWNCPSRKADYPWMSNRRLCIGGYVSGAEVPSDMVSWCWIQDRSVRQGSEQPTSVRPDGSFTSVLHQWQTFYHTFSSWSYPWSWSHEAQCSRHHAFWCYPGGH